MREKAVRTRSLNFLIVKCCSLGLSFGLGVSVSELRLFEVEEESLGSVGVLSFLVDLIVFLLET